MIKVFVEAWEENKNKLEDYFRNTAQEEYDKYSKIVRKLFEVVINPYLEEKGKYPLEKGFNVKDITIVDDGDYQGTQIFIIPLKRYQPSVEDYVYTNTYYGSCSGCDTLLNISSYNTDRKPDEEQIKDYMTLALHLLQKCKWLEEEQQNASISEN